MRPQDNPKEHKRMSNDYNNDEDETETMEENTEPETDGGETEIDDMNVHILGEQLYAVGNPAGGTAYTVDMEDSDHDNVMTCSCPDYRFRAAGNEHRACKHIQAVIRVGPSEYGIERMAYDSLSREYELLSRKVDEVTRELTNVTANAHADAGTSSENRQPSDEQYVNAGDAAGSGEQMAAVTADEAAEKLQTAFDEATKGMNVKAINGKVWINKSPDAPDYTFGAFLRDPDQTRYDPDNAPEQYYQNYIEPGDVDDYINEVLA